MQDANLNSGAPIFKIRILAQFESRLFEITPFPHAKCFHLKSQTPSEH